MTTEPEVLSTPDLSTRGSFTEGSVIRHVIKLSAFLSFGYSSWVVASLLEAVYLGMLGTEQLAAVAFTMPFTMLVISTGYGLGIGASSVIARRVGAGDRKAVSRLCTHTILLGWVIVGVIGGLGVLYAHRLFEILGATPEILVFIDRYMAVWFLGIPFFAPSVMNASLLRATGHAVVPGLLIALGPLIQMVLAPFLIFGWLGFPALGIEGAAWAYVLGRAVTMVIGFYVVIGRERLMSLSLSGILESWRAILHVGLPSMATNIVSPCATAMITRLLADYGPAVVAGFSIGARADAFVMMVLMATGSAIGPFIGMNWGAGQYDRVRLALRMVNRLCIAWGGFCCVIMFVFADRIVTLINQDPSVVTPAVLYLQIVPISITFMGLQNVASSAFNALGKPMPSMTLSLARMVVMYLPLALLGDWLWGYVGIMFATTFTSVVVGTWSWCGCAALLSAISDAGQQLRSRWSRGHFRFAMGAGLIPKPEEIWGSVDSALRRLVGYT